MIRRSLLITSLLLIVLALIPMGAFAKLNDVPNKFEIIKVVKARSVVEVGDALYIMLYNVEYTSPAWSAASFEPIGGTAEGTDATFSGSVMDYDGATTYSGVASVVGGIYNGASLQGGYGYGVWSIYADSNSYATFTFPTQEVICMFAAANGPTPLRECKEEGAGKWNNVGSATEINNSDLKSQIVSIFKTLEGEWDTVNQNQNGGTPNTISLIDVAADGSDLLTELGADYANNTIPKLKAALPSLFEAGTTSPNYVEETFDTTYSDNMTNYFAGTDLDQDPASGSPLVMLGVWLSMPTVVVSTLIVLMFGGSIAGATILATGRSEIGMFSMIMIIQVAAFIGMISFAVAAILAMVGVLALGYIFFYKSSTS